LSPRVNPPEALSGSFFPCVRVRKLGAGVDLEQLPYLALEQGRVLEQSTVGGRDVVVLPCPHDPEDDAEKVLVTLGRLDEGLANRSSHEAPTSEWPLASQQAARECLEERTAP
jgi:hypothetical protein